MAFVPDAWDKYQRWCRLVILLHEWGETLIKDLLNKLGIDIKNGAQLYQKLEPHEKTIKKMPYYLQATILLPTKVDATKLDLSSLSHVIRIVDTQKQYPGISNLRYMRNDLFFMSNSQRDMSQILCQFGARNSLKFRQL